VRNYIYYGLNRTFCDVLDEIRKLDSTKNYSSLLSLIEELQTYGNRMEGALQDSSDIKSMHAMKKELKKEIKELELDRDALKPEESE